MAKEKKPKKEKKGKGGKGGKKKLIFLLAALLVIAAGALVAVRFVMPRLAGGGEGDASNTSDSSADSSSDSSEETAMYQVGQDSVIALEAVMEEGEGELLANRGPGKDKNGENEKYTYVYEIENAAALMNRYLDILLSDEEGFILTDENYSEVLERPELQDAEGAMLLVRNSVQEGHILQMAIGWSQANDSLAVRIAAPEGTLRLDRNQQAGQSDPASVSEQLSEFRSMTPAQLGLPGESMDIYTVLPVDGFVKVDGKDCRCFNVYSYDNPGSIAGTYLLSVDREHIYVLDRASNEVSTIR